MFLGPDIGFVNVFTFVDETQDCKISMTELATVCSDHFQECLDLLASSEEFPKCDAIFLGPDRHQFFQECIEFLESSEGMARDCDTVSQGRTSAT